MTQTAKNAGVTKSDQAASNRVEQTNIETTDGLETADFGLLLKNQSFGGADEPPPSASATILRQLQSADSATLNRKVMRLQKTVGNKSVSRLLSEYQIRRRFAANLHLPDLAGTAKDFKNNVSDNISNIAGNVGESVTNAASDKLVNPALETVQNVAAPVLEAKDQATQVAQTVSDGLAAPTVDITGTITASVPTAAPAQAKFEQAKTVLEQVQEVNPLVAEQPAENKKAVEKTVEVAAPQTAAPAAKADETAPTKDPQLAQAAKGKPEDGVKAGDLVAPAGPVTAPKEADDAAGLAEMADQPVEELDLEKPFKVPGFGEGAEVARTIQRAVDSSLEPPKLKPALAPEQDPAFVAVKQKAQTTAKKEQAHDPAKNKANEAQAAAVPPGNEVSSQAGGNQVGKMNQQEAGTFDKAGFIAAVRQAVEAITPKSEDEAASFSAGDVKQQVSGLVGQNKETAEKNIETTSNEAPDTSAVKPKQVTPMQAEKPGSQPGSIGAEGGMPKPKDAAETSLEYGPNKINKQMEDAKVTEEQLQKSNEPTFQTALNDKKKVEQEAKTQPQQFRQDEKALIEQAKADAKGQAATSLDGMHTQRTDSLIQVDGGKDQTKSKDEQARLKIAGDLEKIYGKTKDDVTKILDGLDSKVNSEFDTGEAAARTEFETYVKNRMDKYKEERYSFSLEGAWNTVRDTVVGLPDEVNAFYTEGRNVYLNKMDALIGRIADIVGRELTAAKNRIAQGLQEIQKYITALPKDLQQIGLEAQQDIQEKFDELKSTVDEKQNELVDSLAQKYVESRNAVDDRIKAMQEENKGLVDKVVDSVKGVIETIIELKNMLLGVLARAAAAIEKIIQDPIGFLSNLLNAIKSGLRQFVSNIGTHLQAGLMGWLTGTLGEAGLKMPAALDLRGILDLVLQITGLTWQNIRSRIAKATSEKFVTRLEKAAEIIMILISEGPAGLWKYIQEQAENMKNQVIEGIKEWVISKVIQAGVSWLVSLFNPAGAFIAAARAIIAVVQFLMERGSQIMSFVNSVLDSVEAIANGSIGGAANAIENSLAKALPLAISFLANLLGLGGISGKIKNIIGKVQKPVNNAIDKVINTTLTKFKSIFKKEDEDKHKQMADEAAKQLKTVGDSADLEPSKIIEQKQSQAREIEQGATPKLANEDNVKLTVTFDKPKKIAKGNGMVEEVEFTVLIAPNDTKKKDKIEIYKPQFSLEPGTLLSQEGTKILTSKGESTVHLYTNHGPEVPMVKLKDRLEQTARLFQTHKAEKLAKLENGLNAAQATLTRFGNKNPNAPDYQDHIDKYDKALEDMNRIQAQIVAINKIKDTDYDAVTQFLKDLRVNAPTATTKFTDDKILEQAVSEALKSNEKQIDEAFLNEYGDSKPVGTQFDKVRANIKTNIGKGYRLGEGMIAEECASMTNVRVVVMISNSEKRKYRVLTAFPEA